MRALTLTACVVLFAAADSSAMAASGCGKGMLWPYVRQPGDCLTDDEIRAGQRGVYNGPVNTNPDLSGIRVETPAQSSGVTGPSGPARAPAAVTAPSVNAPTPAPAADGPALNGPGFAPVPVREASGPCSKGWLWPFVRSPGDCLTDTERGNGLTGVYRSDQVVASVTPVSAPGAGPAGAPGVTPASASGSSESATGGAPSGQAAEPACRKGWLWPFVRRPGDCPTDAERGRR